ncbi:MAG: SpoIID/LytB domain-containing protein, partial [candidate division KSB1 bacterium]|nr:SpoIID/LytB domain-containing protein [candidate division KSB1 bacterium]
RWKIKVGNGAPARSFFTLLVNKFREKAEAQQFAQEIEKKYQVPPRIKTVGGEIYVKENLVYNSTQYWLLVGEFSELKEARLFARRTFPEYPCRVISEIAEKAKGGIEIFDSEYEKLAEAEDLLRVIPESAEPDSYVIEISANWSFQKKEKEYRTFRGIIEFRLDNQGKLSIVAEVPIEEYVTNALSLEMNPQFPDEALKAQAIAIRSKALANLGLKHFNESYHLCSGPHCQVFKGWVSVDPRVRQAVHETVTQVITYNNQPLEAYFDLMCGGYTEDIKNITDSNFDDYFSSIFDGPKEARSNPKQTLSDEDTLKEWVFSKPDVFCNLYKQPVPDFLKSAQKYFRWEIDYSRKELEEILLEKTGIDFGTIYDIIPLKRGVSGRLLAIEILGSRKNVQLEGEDTIRNAFSKNKLNSSCFLITKELDEEGIPYSFTLSGAGYGHGAGLCQVGAAIMAQQGFDHRKILAHYFPKTKIKSVY